MKYLIILVILFYYPSFAQSNLSYAKSKVPYVAPNTKEILQLMNEREQLYYENRDLCNEIESILTKELESLKIDSINILYREGLERNIETITKMKSERNYADYSLQILDIVDDVKKNNLLYEDEEAYSNNVLKEKLRKQEEETLRLKVELEYQKRKNSEQKTNKIQTSKQKK
jgi:hypothetical protein